MKHSSVTSLSAAALFTILSHGAQAQDAPQEFTWTPADKAFVQELDNIFPRDYSQPIPQEALDKQLKTIRETTYEIGSKFLDATKSVSMLAAHYPTLGIARGESSRNCVTSLDGYKPEFADGVPFTSARAIAFTAANGLCLNNLLAGALTGADVGTSPFQIDALEMENRCLNYALTKRQEGIQSCNAIKAARAQAMGLTGPQ